MIGINALCKAFGRQQVLDNVTLGFAAGQSIALIGPNGSGKTTLIKVILGLVLPDGGDVTVGQRSITEGPDYRSMIGYMPQIGRFPEHMKVGRLFGLMQDLRSDVDPSGYDLELYHQLDLARIAHKALGTLSGGMKQHVSAALAFYFNPQILILDEPTAALDPISNEILKAKIRSEVGRGKLVITTSHILSDLDEICNHVVYLMQGRVRFDAPIADLQKQTRESRLNKIVISMLNEDATA